MHSVASSTPIDSQEWTNQAEGMHMQVHDDNGLCPLHVYQMGGMRGTQLAVAPCGLALCDIL